MLSFPAMTPLTLDDVKTELLSWKEIEIAKNSNPVMGHGNPHSNIVFVGEAPGQKEDEQGIPFVGQAGKMLSALLESINLKRDDVYITNIVKFRPPENRDPTPEEKEACLPFLQMELSIIKPTVVVPLGRHALKLFMPHAVIGDVHGKPHTVDEHIIFPLYHPAAALHNPNLRQTLFDDFKALGKFLKNAKV